MAMLDSTLNLNHPLTKLGQAVGTRLLFLSQWLAAYRQYRVVRAELLQYNPQELNELGISDADIDNVARTAARDVQAKLTSLH
jgi:uncharacterized protein YjiS (DUF1127 family)